MRKFTEFYVTRDEKIVFPDKHPKETDPEYEGVHGWEKELENDLLKEITHAYPCTNSQLIRKLRKGNPLEKESFYEVPFDHVGVLVEDSMNIWSPEGTKVFATEQSLNNGYQFDSEKAKKYLEIGKVYTVENIDVDSWRSEVTLKEFPGLKFNTVNLYQYYVKVQPKVNYNEKIAKFMGFIFNEEKGFYRVPIGQESKYQAYHLAYENIKFTSSMDWLHDAIEKIENMGYNTHISYRASAAANFHEMTIIENHTIIAQSYESIEQIDNAEKFDKKEAIVFAVCHFIDWLEKENIITAEENEIH